MSTSYYCKCGASMRVSVSSQRAAKRIGYAWVEAHSGEGHGPCDKKECYKARCKAENDAIKAQQMHGLVNGYPPSSPEQDGGK